jgi:ATP-dependent exoDNAse (exonuclease V) beta subunit
MIRVTELLRWGGITSPLPDTAVVKAAAERGTTVHRLSLQVEDMADKGEHVLSYQKGEPLLTQEIRGYCRSVLAFHKQFKPQWKLREVRIDDEALRLTGCPDRYGILDGKNVVLDYKTGPPQKWHRLQLALYAILLKRDKRPTDRRVDVYLKKDGTFSLAQHDGELDLAQAWNLINRYLDEVVSGN